MMQVTQAHKLSLAREGAARWTTPGSGPYSLSRSLELVHVAAEVPMKTRFLLALTLVGVIAAPAAGQKDVTRRAFTFLDNNLTIQVVSDNAGVLRVMRGESGIVEVRARAPEGVAAASLGGRDGHDLTLTALGSDKVDYIVVVPEEVRVRVILPDRKSLEVASTRPTATYSWAEASEKPAEPSGSQAPASGDGMLLSHSSRAVPRILSIPEYAAMTQLDVKFEGSDFRISTSRPVSVQPGRSDEILFRTGNEPISVVVMLPQNTRDFRLVLGDKTAIEVVDGDVHSYCQQLIDQKLPDGRRYFTYHPAGAGLVCR